MADDVVELLAADDVVELPGVAAEVVELPGVAAEDPHAARVKTVTATISRRLTPFTVRTAISADK
jgi:hypothetical protein